MGCSRIFVAIAATAAMAIGAGCGGAPRSGDSGLPSGPADTLPAVADDAPAAERSVRPAVPINDVTPIDPGLNADVHIPDAQVPGAQSVELDQPAIWPAADVVFATPEEAAASFVSNVLGVEPVLGDFMSGDSRSGEIQVFSPGDVEGAELLERGVLNLRMIGPSDGWFVIAASSQGVMIESPEALDRVAVGPLEVTGQGRGFEGTLNVIAFRAGDAEAVLDLVISRGGAFAELEPFTATVDLSEAVPGETIALLLRGDTGLDGDPGDFATLPVVIDSTLPPTS